MKEKSDDSIVKSVSSDADGSACMSDAAKAFGERRSGTGKPEISTGFSSIDRAIIGWRPKVYVLAGRPGMGKSAMAGSLRRNVIKQGYVWVTFGLEMDKSEMCERELSYQANLNLRRIMSAKEATSDEAQRVVTAASALDYSKWRIYDNCFSMAEIETAALAEKAAAEKAGLKIGGFEIDYLQLMGDVGSEGRTQSVSACSRRCKILQKRMQCGLLLLSQLNRGCEYRDDKRPLSADLRESGSIEQDADLIAMMYRDHVYNPLSPDDEAEFIIRKQRSGPIGTVRLRFNGRTTSFSDPPPVQNMIAPTGEC